LTKLFLDDTRQPPDSSWEVVRSYEEFVAYVELHGVPDLISFDHDLADQHYMIYRDTPSSPEKFDEHYGRFFEKTGYDCAKWLAERGTLPAEYLVHSLNPVGAQNIRFVMDGAYRRREQSSAV
jgi:hypothetical protein